MADKILSPFLDVENKPLDTADLYGQTYLDMLSAFQIGAGAKSFKADRDGMWLGANRFASAPFRVDMLGNLVATSAVINAYRKSFTSNIAWTSTDADTASWGAGTLYFADGTTYSIASGNTGNIAATTYVYLDTAVSSTVLQTTTDPATASGATKTLIAIVTLVSGANCAIDVQSGIGTVISGGKITTASLAAISALLGTVDVGGSGNGNGVLNVKDAAGAIKVILDNAGITINDGKLTIKDSSATTIIDATGLVSTANFSNNFVTDSNAFTTTSDSFVDVTNMTLTFSLSRTSNVLIGASVVGRNDNTDTTNAYSVITQILADSTQVGGYMTTPGIYASGGIANTTAATSIIVSLAAGSHTVKLQTMRSGGGTARLTASNPKTLWYVVLGK